METDTTMKYIKKTLYITLIVIAFVLILCSILSLFADSSLRYLKMLNFPRIQCFIAALITLILLIITSRKRRSFSFLIALGLIISMGINSYYLISYTALVPKKVESAENLSDNEVFVSILLVNVKMKNRIADPLLAQIRQTKPDLILAMEVDKWWNETLDKLEDQYPYSQKTTNEVAYGMVLYSKFPFQKKEELYLNNKNVPSFISTIKINENKIFKLYSIHPVPPTHFENLPDNEGQDAEAFKDLGELITNRKLPIVVAGDMNDAVWAMVDDLTKTSDILHDVREGRGFYNSFSAENFWMKWPLDHVFVTEEFKLHKIERLEKFGSDHFPIFVKLVL